MTPEINHKTSFSADFFLSKRKINTYFLFILKKKNIFFPKKEKIFFYFLTFFLFKKEKKKILFNKNLLKMTKTRFGSRVFGRSTFWKTCKSVVNYEDMDSSFPVLTKWEAHIM